jgi:hypothetical protein
LQPAERIRPDGTLSPQISGGLNWSPLRVGGGNGLIVVVVGLAMWREGLDVGKLTGSVAHWDALVKDVKNVFATLSITGPKAPLSPPRTQPSSTKGKKRQGSLLVPKGKKPRI